MINIIFLPTYLPFPVNEDTSTVSDCFITCSPNNSFKAAILIFYLVVMIVQSVITHTQLLWLNDKICWAVIYIPVINVIQREF